MSETLSETMIREWKSSPELQAEFMGDFQAYAAFCKANAAGLVRIQGRK